MLELILLKFFVAVGAVLGLSLISERMSPATAGFLAGLPTGTAISLFFFGLEHGTDFAAQSAVHNLSGMVALQVFIFLYYVVSVRIKITNIFTIALVTIISVIGYALSVYVINALHLDLFGSVLALIISIPFFIYLFRRIEPARINGAVTLSFPVLGIRSVIASSIIVTVISIAGSVGPAWAGLFSAFPTTLFPLILITHLTYGIKPTHALIKRVPEGLGGMLIYGLGVFFTYPSLGIYIGTIASYALVFFYVLSYRMFAFRSR